MVVIDANGNVGINNTNPQYKLDVTGTANIAGQLNTAKIVTNGDVLLNTGLFYQAKTKSPLYFFFSFADSFTPLTTLTTLTTTADFVS